MKSKELSFFTLYSFSLFIFSTQTEIKSDTFYASLKFVVVGDHC